MDSEYLTDEIKILMGTREGQLGLMLASSLLMEQATRYCRREAILHRDEFPERAQEYDEYAVENDNASSALYAVAMTYDLPIWDVDEEA